MTALSAHAEDYADLHDPIVQSAVRALGITPGCVQPELSGVQIIPSTLSLGQCCACDRPVMEFTARFCGTQIEGRTLLIHFECAEETGLYQKTVTRQASDSKPDAQTILRYRQSLARVRTATLGSMLAAYEDHPEQRTPEMTWQIQSVRAEFDRRLVMTQRGKIPAADRDLADAAALRQGELA